jgi:hypothetical protein
MRRAAILMLVLSSALRAATPAHAESGGVDDPQGDWTSGSGPFDISRVTHSDDDNFVMYTVESFGDFQLNRLTLEWGIDCKDSPDADVAVSMRPTNTSSGVTPVVTVQAIGGPKLADGTAAQNGRVATITYPRSALTEAGCGGAARYELFAPYSEPSNHVDRVPNDAASRVTHTLSGDTTATSVAPTTTGAAVTTIEPATTLADTSTQPATTLDSGAVTSTTDAVDTTEDDDSPVPIIVLILILGAVALAAIIVIARNRDRRRGDMPPGPPDLPPGGPPVSPGPPTEPLP